MHSDYQASYDENGDIVLQGHTDAQEPVEPVQHKEEVITKDDPIAWNIIEETHQEVAENQSWSVIDEPVLQTEAEPSVPYHAHIASAMTSVRKNVTDATNLLMEEGKRQYSVSAGDAHGLLKNLTSLSQESLSELWAFLTQPVWVLRKNKEPKQYSRITLFTLDVVRFGGTFATIFVALFSLLNYQSFWEIAAPHFNPIQYSITKSNLNSEVQDALKEKLLKSPSLAVAGREEGNMLSFLPEVGPPENRIIIPRLGLNVPLVTPSFDSLLKEDWAGVEEDIQEALQYGVVHYPGTARPGQAGNFFVTGHSSYYPWASGEYKTIFARLHELEVGDEYWVYYGGDKHRYVIAGRKEVRPSDVSVLDQPVNKRVGTLMTCTPIGTNLRRLILTAHEVDVNTGVALEVGQQQTRPTPKIELDTLPI